MTSKRQRRIQWSRTSYGIASTGLHHLATVMTVRRGFYQLGVTLYMPPHRYKTQTAARKAAERWLSRRSSQGSKR